MAKDPHGGMGQRRGPRRIVSLRSWLLLGVCVLVVAAIAVGIIAMRQQYAAVKVLADYAHIAYELDGQHFFYLDAEATQGAVAALREIGLEADEDRSRTVVPQLSAYPGWFDFGLAARYSMMGHSQSLDRGRVRLFYGSDRTYIVVLSNAARSAPKFDVFAPGDVSGP